MGRESAREQERDKEREKEREKRRRESASSVCVIVVSCIYTRAQIIEILLTSTHFEIESESESEISDQSYEFLNLLIFPIIFLAHTRLPPLLFLIAASFVFFLFHTDLGFLNIGSSRGSISKFSFFLSFLKKLPPLPSRKSVTRLNHECDIGNQPQSKPKVWETIQGGEDPLDALSCRSFSAKEPLITGLFCGWRLGILWVFATL